MGIKCDPTTNLENTQDLGFMIHLIVLFQSDEMINKL